MVNLSANHFDTRVSLNRGLTCGDDKTGGLGLRGKGDKSGLLQGFDSSTVVRNLCASMYYHHGDYFYTYTCNQKTHYGVKNIKLWIDGDKWKKNYPGWDDLTDSEQREVEEALIQSAAVLLVRNWQEVMDLFLTYLRKSPTSPFRKVESIFVRHEYQKDRGNLSHIHLILEVKWKDLSPEEEGFVEDLIRASILDIVRTEEVESLINEGIFKSLEEYHKMIKYAMKFLPHRCHAGCLVRVGPGPSDFICKKVNNRLKSSDPTKHMFKESSSNWSQECIDRLVKIGLAEEVIDENSEECEKAVKFHHSYFEQRRHIPPTNASDDVNMSPVEGKTFAASLSMQNLQLLRNCGGVNKYVCKYIGKIDEQNYIIIFIDGKGQLVSKKVFLHNTKVAGSKINEEKAKNQRRDKANIRGRLITHIEQIQSMFKYREIYTDLSYIQIGTVPLEYRAGVDKRNQKESHYDPNKNDNNGNGDDIYNAFHDVDDEAIAGCVSEFIRRAKGIEEWRCHTENELLTFDGVQACKLSVDKVSKFSLRPPELRYLFNKIREYYRWFEYLPEIMTGDNLMDRLNEDVEYSIFVDGLMHQVKVREEAFIEMGPYLDKKEEECDRIDEANDTPCEKVQVIRRMILFFQKLIRLFSTDAEDLSEDEMDHLEFAKKNLVISHADDEDYHLPIPVFSYSRPTTGVNFILHILLSLGEFETEIDLTTHKSLRECLRYANLIGPSNDPQDLETYSDNLLRLYIEEQVITFPNSRRVIQSWIVAAGDLFDKIIIDDEIPVTDLPAVQQSALFQSQEERCVEFRREARKKIIAAALLELGEETIKRCKIPSAEELMNATKDEPLDWDPVENFTLSPCQPESSYEEQKFAIETIVKAIDKYCTPTNLFTKCTGIRGFPGSGKTWCMEYCIIYALSKGLNCMTTSMICKRSIQLGGKHIDSLFGIPFEKANVSAGRLAELAEMKIISSPEKQDMLRSLDCLFMDELGQLSSFTVGVLDLILRKIRDTNVYLGGLFVSFTMDHTQIKPFDGRPFLTSSQVIPCYRSVELTTSVRAAADARFSRAQAIARLPHWKLEESPELVEEFISLIDECCTFVDDWQAPEITTSTFRLYSKKVPSKEATLDYVERVRRQIPANQLMSRKSEDWVKDKMSHSEWSQATNDSVIDELDQHGKEPRELLFFKGAQYEFTFNKEGKFSNTQLAVLFEMPSQDQLDRFKPIKILAAPPGIKSLEYDVNTTSKQDLLDIGFTEVTVGASRERTRSLKGNLRGKRKQYGLQHRLTSTIHAAQGETFALVATEISENDPDFNLWDKGQLIVLISRTRHASNTIFVGNKMDTLSALRAMLNKKTQWDEYIEKVLDLITVRCNTTSNQRVRQQQRVIMTQDRFPFSIRNVPLPQCRTGFVYFLISLKQKNFTYIGTTDCIRERVPQHNNGYGASATTPEYLRPYGVMGYICGFDGCHKELRYHIERQWKLKRNNLKSRGCQDPREWVRIGNKVIEEVGKSDAYDVESFDLKLVCLFKNK